MFTIDTRSRVPIYEQLKERIIEMIVSGVLTEDDQLPSVRSLARDLGINPNTVQKAYQELDAEGIIYQAAGRGSFIGSGDEVKRVLENKRLLSLYEELRLAKSAGIDKARVLTAVDQVYEGERVS